MSVKVVKVCYVFSGSGTKFPVFIGALKALEEQAAIDGAVLEVNSAIGTSGGAIIAAGVANGYDNSVKLEKFCRELMPTLVSEMKPSLWNLVRNLGLLKTNTVLKALQKFLPQRMRDTKISLQLTTTNLDADSPEKALSIYSTRGTPEVSLPHAVLASMSIPFVFPYIMINNQRHVDGGWLKNFAVDEIRDDCLTIGFYFKLKAPGKSRYPWWRPIKRLLEFAGRLINLAISYNVVESIKDASSTAVLYELETDNDGLDLDITQEDITQMIEDGYYSVKGLLQ